MSELEADLLKLLQQRSFKRGTFTLASGDTSDYYIDGRTTEVFSRGAYLIGNVIYERTKDLDIQAIGGLAVGAVPLTTAAVISYHQHGREMEGFWVRDQVKDHGTRRLIEGKLGPGDRCVIVEDVITKGTSSLKAVEEVRKAGAEVVLVLALVDRSQGARELLETRHSLKFVSVFTIRDFGIAAEDPLRAARAASG
jgi:orotate phosphoribosyltransferase